jgi:beta-lactamase class A
MKIFILAALFFVGCTAQTAIPTEFPTPPTPASATPLPRVEYRRDGELEKQFAEIAKDAKGKVGVAAVVLETGDAAFLNEQGQYPMQSVYKLPIAMAVMDEVRQGKLELDEKIGVTKDDVVRPGQASVIRDKNPNGGEYTVRELIRLALVESDGTASDVLMRIAGGPDEVHRNQIGKIELAKH